MQFAKQSMSVLNLCRVSRLVISCPRGTSSKYTALCCFPADIFNVLERNEVSDCFYIEVVN